MDDGANSILYCIGFQLLTFVAWFFHLRCYNRLVKGIQSRNLVVWDKYEYPGANPSGSAGAIPQLAHIEKKFKGALEEGEVRLIRVARLYYYGAGIYSLSVWAAFILYAIAGLD
jgi:hypothetical protein